MHSVIRHPRVQSELAHGHYHGLSGTKRFRVTLGGELPTEPSECTCFLPVWCVEVSVWGSLGVGGEDVTGRSL